MSEFKEPSYSMTSGSISIFWEGKPYVVQEGAPNYVALKQAIQDKNWDEVPKHLNVVGSLKAWVNGLFTVEGDRFSYNGQALPEELNSRIMKMVTQGENPKYLFNFWEKLQKNPSWRSVQQLWKFLEHQGIPIDCDGNIIGYKGVNTNYTDCHTGTIDNSPGAVIEMPRNLISDDPNQGCHVGLHIGSEAYATSFGARCVIVKVDPADVVCIPYDASYQKMRACKYKVIGNYGMQLPGTSYQNDVPTSENTEEVEVGEVGNPCVVEGNENQEQDPKPKTVKFPKEALVFFTRSELKKLHQSELVDLMSWELDSLRKYATNALKIVGASKIPGGKLALAKKIIETRDGTKNT